MKGTDVRYIKLRLFIWGICQLLKTDISDDTKTRQLHGLLAQLERVSLEQFGGDVGSNPI